MVRLHELSTLVEEYAKTIPPHIPRQCPNDPKNAIVIIEKISILVIIALYPMELKTLFYKLLTL